MSMVLTERDGSTLTIWVNHPPYNFLTTPVMAELDSALRSAQNDRAVRAVVLTGASPGVFIGHFDIAEMLEALGKVGLSMPIRLAPAVLRAMAPVIRTPGLRELVDRSPATGIATLLRFHATVQRLRASDKVFVAAIDGPAVGGGFELALACDVRVMGDGPYEVGLVEILLGLLPGGGGSQLVTRMLGSAATVEMLLEGRLFIPAEALKHGLVHRLVARDKVYDEAQETARRLAHRAPEAVRLVKRAVYDAGSARFRRGMAMERAAFMSLASRSQTQQALGQYLQDVSEHQSCGGSAADFARQRLPAWQAGGGGQFP